MKLHPVFTTYWLVKSIVQSPNFVRVRWVGPTGTQNYTVENPDILDFLITSGFSNKLETLTARLLL
ncbi:conserved hypothetical protein [Sphingobacterium multivorum]|uniref:Uncharacterized protein n=1 Tax=Sphingobacterium multivorum TaxID=28454 RepID=A0A654DP14_SPHMU|nr:conserved hypothetical protein [Sphingobacterium multivorum]